ncbi:MAG: A/G-specific adenine glycosylase, partial [Agathobacter sp.]|nr:A/G-specific adenine glycosylase [Agathobacter sp.]
LPNVEGYLTENEIIDYIKGEGYQPIRIQPICDAKHIFSHVEWHMKGYVVFLQAQGYEKDANQVDTNNAEETQHEDWLFVDVEETKEKYAIPSAFVKYTEYLNLVIGKDAIVSSDKV